MPQLNRFPSPLILTNQHQARTTEPLEVTSNVQPAVSTQYPAPTTQQLKVISDTLPPVAVTPSLIAALQATMTTRTIDRVVVIPGAGKRIQAESKKTHTTRRMSSRLRQSIVLATLLVVVITSLLSLIPLASGQYPFPVLQGISNWFQSQVLNWQFPAHGAVTIQSHGPILPSMSLPQSQYVPIAQQDAVDAGIPAEYFLRQINLESGFNPSAVSPAGAVGIAQFLPGTAAGLGINPWDPIQALRGAARLMKSYEHLYNGNYAMALAAYNGGTGAVQRAINLCGSAWINCLVPETRNYIYIIMGI
jgi:Transglycosylase SLT domain